MNALSHASNDYAIPRTMKAWTLGGPRDLSLVEKPVPVPGPAEVLVRIDAVAVCATDLEIIKHGLPAMVEGEHRRGAPEKCRIKSRHRLQTDDVLLSYPRRPPTFRHGRW